MNSKLNEKTRFTGVNCRILVLVSQSEIEKRRNEFDAAEAFVRHDGDESAASAQVSVSFFCDVAQLIEAAQEKPVNAIVLDNRGEASSLAFSSSVAGRALPEILARVTSAGRLVRNAVLTVLPEGPALAHHAFAVGSLQLGGVIVNPASMKELIETVCTMIRKPAAGKDSAAP